ncbi:hypothetical protein M436DRAFT_62138 [Aureobasidium namibiae CBS 147.97]|uniref:Cryptic loci regulator 2 N-terminal domain-containing protein n=1 Tax=Aureobasidium namibiae CBS 147.97 TaxID=1043004 RepID=A0A074XJG3_9PEZI
MAQPRLQLDLSRLTSDGTTLGPSRRIYYPLADSHMLKLLTMRFNESATSVLYWGIEMEFVGALPHGFSEWTHDTSGQGVTINEVFGSPRNIRYRSGSHFLGHVEEIMRANENTIRVQIQNYQPNNAQNNSQMHVQNTAINCGC